MHRLRGPTSSIPTIGCPLGNLRRSVMSLIVSLKATWNTPPDGTVTGDRPKRECWGHLGAHGDDLRLHGTRIGAGCLPRQRGGRVLGWGDAGRERGRTQDHEAESQHSIQYLPPDGQRRRPRRLRATATVVAPALGEGAALASAGRERPAPVFGPR